MATTVETQLAKNESRTVESNDEETIEPSTLQKIENTNRIVVTNENFDNCTLKRKKRFRCYWRMIGALHDMGHALTRLPCIAEQPDDFEEKRKEYTTQKKVF